MTEVPPSRWKVIERGRRLEVIDTRDPGATSRAREAEARGIGAAPGLPRRLRFDGTLGWTTHPFYDAKGPRAVVLDGGTARWIGGVAAAGAAVVIAALVAGVALLGVSALPVIGAVAVMGSSAVKGLKPWVTRRLDGIAT